ncbi:hypothetical protein WME79_47915 [Sorangium sp. So ce726]|uniref:hypothetical protein n=1 Tax=Sorangium sp. So ce726 TaxID=3133319 RepID=UPI003F6365DA
MLTIRAEQVAVFQRDLAERFKDRILAHIRDAWPEDYEALGEPGARRLIDEGITRAARYGITLDYDVVRYINTMICLSPCFDEDPNRPWARAILGDASLGSREKTDLLCLRAEMEPEAACAPLPGVEDGGER